MRLSLLKLLLFTGLVIPVQARDSWLTREIKTIGRYIQKHPVLTTAVCTGALAAGYIMGKKYTQKTPQEDPAVYSVKVGALFWAILQDRSDVINALLDADPLLINSTINKGTKPLHAAVQTGKRHLVELLLNRGALVNDVDEHGITPLHWAAGQDLQDIAELLIAQGATLEAETNNGLTPLTTAISLQKLNMTALLIRAGASVTNPNKQGRTAVHSAASQDNIEIAQLVIEHSETVELFDQDAQTPLFFACAKGKPAVVRLLLDKGASPHVCALDGSMPLHWAMRQSSTESTEQEKAELKEVIRILLDKKVDVLAKDSDGMTALHWAALYNCIAGAEVLLEKNISINIDATPHGLTPLHLAAFKGNLEFVRFLVQKAADVNALDAQRFTPLHCLALQKNITEMHIKTAILLISCGCDYQHADNNAQKTAYELAQHESIRELLRDPQAYITRYQNILNN